MDIIQSIRNNFNKGYFGKAMRIDGLPEEYPAWTIKSHKWFGVAVKMDRRVEFSEKFSSARIFTSFDATLEGEQADLLLLTCSDNDLRNEFATICSQFVTPGSDGSARKQLIDNPSQWWGNWKSLVGNTQSERQVYSVIAELIAIKMLLHQGKHPKWAGIEHATHDIELPDRSYEVKSTIQRYGYEVEINSIHQMRKVGETLDLVFMRFEKSQLGESLNDVVDSVVQMGYPRDQLEQALEKAGLEKGCTARAARYKLLETRVYPVDNDFPALTLDSFVGGALPPSVIKVKYTLDLSGVASRTTI